MRTAQILALLVIVAASSASAQLYQCRYLPRIKLALMVDYNSSVYSSNASAVRTKRDASTSSSMSTPNTYSSSVTEDDTSPVPTSDPVTPTITVHSSVSAASVSKSPVSSAVLSSTPKPSRAATSASTTTITVSPDTTDTTENTTYFTAAATSKYVAPTAAPKCNLSGSYMWFAYFAEDNAPLVYVTENTTKVFVYDGYNIGNTSTETSFLKQHYEKMKTIASNYTTENCTQVTVQMIYECCYAEKQGSSCTVRKIVNGNSTYDVDFNSTYVENAGKDQSKDTDFHVWLNETTTKHFWPKIGEISNRWEKFLDYMGYRSKTNLPYGYTKILESNTTNENATVKCFVHAMDPYGLEMSWILGDNFIEEKINHTWIPDMSHGSGVGWTSINVSKSDVTKLKCYVSSSRGGWSSTLHVPSRYGPLHIGSEIPLALVAAIGAAIVVFIFIACIGCCVCICNRRQKELITNL
nr:membrane protein b165 [Mastomys natalensis cytomegalovirus 3]